MDELSKILEDMKAAIVNGDGLDEAAQEIPQILQDQINLSFWDRSDPDGREWAPLKDPPTKMTGRMIGEALEAIKNGTTSNKGYESAGYSQPHYWPFQDEGTAYIPERQFFAVGDDSLDKIAERVSEVIVSALVSDVNWSRI